MTITANPLLDLPNIIISPLDGGHVVSNFSCGEHTLDKFISKKCQKYHSSNRVKAFCAHQRESKNVCGLYTLTMKIEETNKLLNDERQHVSDKHFPAIYIGTLAVKTQYQKQGLGTILLVNALRRAYYVSQNVAVFGVALRSLNERTTKLYMQYGFGLRDQSQTPLMVLPIWSLNELINGAKS